MKKKTAKEELWVKLPVRLLIDYDLTSKDIVLLAVLIDTSDRFGISWPSLRELARLCSCSERTVRRSEARLCELGLISITKTGRESMIAITDQTLISANEWSAIKHYRKAE